MSGWQVPELPGTPGFRITALGTGTAAPEFDTAASGLLLQSGETSILFDAGTGVAARLQATVGANALNAIVIGHQHADHWLDLAPMRYRFDWGERSNPRLPVYLPPGGTERLTPLAFAIAERPSFFADAYDVREYADQEAFAVGPITVRPVASQHYVPAWTMDITAPGGQRIVYGGDMGPTDATVELARGCDLLILEATLETSIGDDPRRGHLTTEEAIDMARRSGAKHTWLVHYRTARRELIRGLCEASGISVEPAVPFQQLELAR